MKTREKPKAAIVLMVQDHMGHGVGCTDSSLDRKARVAWAWRAAKNSPAAKHGRLVLWSLNVTAGSVNGSKTSPYAELLAEASAAAGRVLPALAQSWNSNAPNTLQGNVSAKLGSYEKMKRRKLVIARSSRHDSESEDEPWQQGTTVEEGLSCPMEDLQGAKKAAQAMLVASVFAAELSTKERLPVLVLGRPPGHHSTCAHEVALETPRYSTPGGSIPGKHLGGGCFYPSCWLAAVHCMREGFSQKLAYVDIDAHKPDGVWMELDNLCKSGRTRRAAVFNGKSDVCEGVFFTSMHLDGYPKKSGYHDWQSVTCTIPKGPKRAFEVRLNEELLPKGVTTGDIKTNDVVLDAFARWNSAVEAELLSFEPNGVFVGLGFDLHKCEEHVDKQIGLGLDRRQYRKLMQDFPTTALTGPVVLTLEGGYTKAGVTDGMLGVISGLDALARKVASANQRPGAVVTISAGLRRKARESLLRSPKEKAREDRRSTKPTATSAEQLKKGGA